MRILFVAGIFPPEIGGPSMYAARLRDVLSAHGHDVRVVTYVAPGSAHIGEGITQVPRSNKFLNRARYFIAVWPEIYRADAVYMLDWFAAGLPAALTAKILRKPYIVRVGGDYLWEQRYLESGKEPVSLSQFYACDMHRSYPLLYRAIRFVLKGAAHVVFNSDIQRRLYERHYDLENTSVIENPTPRIALRGMTRGEKKEFVYWGRFIIMKNVTALVRAFARANIPQYTLALIGEGPRREEIATLIKEVAMEGRISLEPVLPNAAVLERVQHSRAFVLPSWTDISPNQVYEALALGLPSLVTKENYLSIRDQLPLTIDPSSVEDIAAKLQLLADDAQYQQFANAFRAVRHEHSWDAVAKEHEVLFAKNV